MNKYTYLHVLQGNYGMGWEDLCASEIRREVHQHLREYNENEGGWYRIVERRVLNEAGEGRRVYGEFDLRDPQNESR